LPLPPLKANDLTDVALFGLVAGCELVRGLDTDQSFADPKAPIVTVEGVKE
jgi:hypothetical protein